MNPLTSQQGAVKGEEYLTEKERAILRALNNLRDTRCEATVLSFFAAKYSLESAALAEVSARQLYDEATLLPTESDDFAEATAATEKWERIESEYLTACRTTWAAVKRVQWEIRQAQKAGIIK